MRITFVFALLLIVLATIFAVQNNASIEITLLFWKVHGSLALVLVIAFTLGILIAFLVSTPASLRKRGQLSELRKKLHLVESDLEQARKALASPSPEELAPGQTAQDTLTESHPEAPKKGGPGSSEGQ